MTIDKHPPESRERAVGMVFEQAAKSEATPRH